jgi:hypothetical protein
VSEQIYLAFGLALCFAFVFILRAWRRGIYLVFAWLLLEDVVRRLVPGQPVQVQLVKEVLLLWTYIAFFLTWRKQNKPFWSPPFLPILLAFSIFVLIEALNPESQGLFVPAIGMRSYLWYVPLLWVGYHAFRTRTEVVRFNRALLPTALPLAALGVIQYVMWEQLPAWLLPLEGAHAFHSTAFEYGGTILSYNSELPSSVFGSAHRFAMFSLFLFFLGIGMWRWGASSHKRSGRLFLTTVIVASLVCIVVAGTRMCMLLALVGLLLLLIEPALAARRGFLARKVRVRRALACLIMGSAFFGILQIFSATGRFFLYTTEGDVETHWEQFTRGQLPYVLKRAAWLGFGTGTLSQGVTYVPGGKDAFDFASREAEGIGVEYGLAKVTWELGLVGLALFLFLWTHIFQSVWRNLRALRTPETQGLAWALGIFLVLVFVAFLKGHQYFGDGTTLVVYWFGMGMFFSLRRLDRMERMRLEMARSVGPRAAMPNLSEARVSGYAPSS